MVELIQLWLNKPLVGEHALQRKLNDCTAMQLLELVAQAKTFASWLDAAVQQRLGQ